MFTDRLTRVYLAATGDKSPWASPKATSNWVSPDWLRDLPITRAALALKMRLSQTSAKDSVTPNQKVSPSGSQQTSADQELTRNLIDRYLRSKKAIEAIAVAHGISAVFVWQPVPVYGYDLKYHLLWRGGQDGEQRIRAYFAYPQMAALVKQKLLGRDFLWCADVQYGVAEPLYVDAIHYSAELSRRLAACIGKLTVERKLVPASGVRPIREP